MTILAYIGGFAMEHPLLAICAYFLIAGFVFDVYEDVMGLRRRA